MRQVTLRKVWQARKRYSAPSAAQIRRAFYFRPLALLLAITMLQLSGLPPSGSVPPAAAASDPCAPSADRIIQDICINGVPNADLIQFENDTIDGWLTAHQMPLSNRALIFQYGRSDLRSQLRAQMMGRILAIIAKGNSERTSNEKVIYAWLLNRMQKKEIEVYQTAVDDRDSWENDPCHWKPDPDIAKAFGLHYTGGAFCSQGLATLFTTTPQVPSKSYFIAAGFKQAYSKISEFSHGNDVLNQTYSDLIAAAAAAGISSVTALGAGAITAGAFASIFPFAFNPVTEVALVSAGAVAAGVAIIVLFAVIVGVVAAFELYDAQQTLDELAELDNLLLITKQFKTPLTAFAHNKEGMTKLVITFVEATLPEYSSAEPLPSRTTDDPQFIVSTPPFTVTLSDTITYKDWDDNVWTATPHLGFLIQNGMVNGNPVTSFSPQIHFKDPDTGDKLTADLVGTNFLVARETSDFEGKSLCLANPFTGLSDASDLSTCIGYAASSITFRDGNDEAATATISTRPAFTSLPGTTFTSGVAKEFTITALGAPLPLISLQSGTLPPGITFEDSLTVGFYGQAKLVYDGMTALAAGQDTIGLVAQTGFRFAFQTFTIQTGTMVNITSSTNATFTAGKSGSFLVTTSGDPAPAITVAPNCLPSGLALQDNGDGTATISGTPDQPQMTDSVCEIDATNVADSDSVNLDVKVQEPPLAGITSADSTTFFAGGFLNPPNNSFEIVTRGAETPVTISLPCGDAPGWAFVNDHGNGTATLHGLPSFGTDGAFSFHIEVHTQGQYDGPPDCADKNFTVNVSDVPTFLSPNRVDFGPPPITGGAFIITTNQDSGSISLGGTLPANLTFSNIGHGEAEIQGIPQTGTGGTYPLVLSMTNARGTGTQFLQLQVKEAPEIQAYDSIIFYVGIQNSYAVQTTGFPKLPAQFGNTPPLVTLYMDVSASGALPSGVSFTDTNQFDLPTGTGVLAGIPDAGTEGVYHLTVTAANGVLPNATHDLTLYVVQPGDVNHDGVVDNKDAEAIEKSLSEHFGDTTFNNLLDTNDDGIIDAKDLQFVLDNCPDPDGDGVCESQTADRDGDGIPDAYDYDPTGYLYDITTGKILSGGKVIVSPAPATMPHDGSDGFYQFTVTGDKQVYTMTVVAPPGCERAACGRLDPPPLDPMGTTVSLGSSEDDSTGFLVSHECSDNPNALTFNLGQVGDQVINDNIPFDCRPVRAPAADPRGILLLILALLAVAAVGFRRRRGLTPSED